MSGLYAGTRPATTPPLLPSARTGKGRKVAAARTGLESGGFGVVGFRDGGGGVCRFDDEGPGTW